MENRIRRIEVHDGSLNPVAAEVWIAVQMEYRTETTEVRGRLMGPRCLYSSTIEVAYPLRPVPSHQMPQEPSGLTVRAVIPEASLWEPQCPFLYHGPIELWQDGQRCDRINVNHGLRSLRRSERGLLVNGRPLALHGRRIASCSDEEATAWRQAGYNLLIAPVAAGSLAVWEHADRFGFLMLGQLIDEDGETHWVETLRRHASCLGWLSAECREMNAEEAVAWYMAGKREEPEA